MQVTSDAMAYLASMPKEVKIAPVALIGAINSGKSFLANQLAGVADAFTVAKA